jgi:hypothetical protein
MTPPELKKKLSCLEEKILDDTNKSNRLKKQLHENKAAAKDALAEKEDIMKAIALSNQAMQKIDQEIEETKQLDKGEQFHVCCRFHALILLCRSPTISSLAGRNIRLCAGGCFIHIVIAGN